MSDRDDIAEIISMQLDLPVTITEDAADVILNAGYSKPRTVTSEQELDALPELSVVTDCYVDVWQRRGGEWCSYDTRPMQAKRIVRYAPLTVVWTPPEVVLTHEGA